MRNAIHEHAQEADSDRLLSTGEAAVLLNASRQHVVDLCTSGQLPYVTTGKHRRVSRRDVELLRARSQSLTKDQARSLWLGFAVAGKVAADSRTHIEQARKALIRTRASGTRGQAVQWLDEWQRILDGPAQGVMEALTSLTPKSRELRQNSPFSASLTEPERAAVLRAFAESRASK